MKKQNLIGSMLLLLMLTLAAMSIQHNFAVSETEMGGGGGGSSVSYYYYYYGGVVTLDGDYTYTVTDGKAEITKYTGSGGAVTIPSTLDGATVTSIGQSAFAGCSSLTSITIPQGVTSIGWQAFASCSGLTSIIIPQGVTSIGISAFSGCSGLTGITIPQGVTSISNTAFSGCSGLTNIIIPQGVASIGSGAFIGCRRLISIAIPQGVTSIGNGTFAKCWSLTSITVDANNTTYASENGVLFNKAKTILMACPGGLTSVSIPQSVTSIANYAFEGCKGLTNVIIPQGVTSIGAQVFQGCESLTSITIPQGVTNIWGGAFSGCTSLNSITIPQGVTSIGNGAFRSCTSLTSITIEEGIISIGDQAFSGCTGLTSIIFDSATTSIYDTADTIPSTTKIIGYNPSTAKTYAIKYNRTFEIAPNKTVAVAGQVGTIKAATASQSATFAVTTANISSSKAVTIAWFASDGTTPAAAPTGITATGTDLANNASIITLNADATSVAGSYYFKATIDGVTSPKVVLSVFTTETNALAPIELGTTPTYINVPLIVTNSSLIPTVLATTNVGKQATLPAVQVSAATTLGTIEVSIPDSTSVTGPSSWNGTINLPTVQPTTSVTATPAAGYTNTVQAVIEVGYGDVKLTFDKAVRLLIPGQGGKLAGYSRGGVFTAIPKPAGALDTQAWADSNIVAESDAAMDVGSDLVIWTKHFTKFASYTQTANSGGGGGGSIAAFTGALVTASVGGIVSGSGATILIPASAINSDIKVNVAKVSDIVNLSAPSQGKIIGDVLEITKDKTDNFIKAVTITLPFDQNKVDITKYDICIYWLDNTANKWVKLDNTIVDTLQGKVSGDITHFTKFALIATEKTEKAVVAPPVVVPALNLNDIAGNWAEANIKSLVNAGTIAGYPDGSFKPDNTITRAEFAVVLAKAFKLETKNGKVFTDTENHWAQDYIATANAFGIINGYSDIAFGPDDMITREQMVAMIVKAAKLEIIDSGKSFSDDSQISSWAKSAVITASGKQIISGYSDNSFSPQGNATRAEAVTVVVKALK